MARAAARPARTRRPHGGRPDAGARARRRHGALPPPLEHRILMTATLCLLAFGAVMVYSASSPIGVLSGKGLRHRGVRPLPGVRRARAGRRCTCSSAAGSRCSTVGS